MAQTRYLDFDLQITPTAAGYKVRVLNSPAGQPAGEFQLPFSAEELAGFLEQLEQSNNRQSALFEKGMVRTVGAQLFDTLFQGPVLACLTRSLDKAQQAGAILRIKLRLNEAPQLLNWPWEYLHYGAGNRFLALSNLSSLVHFLELPEPLSPLEVEPPVGVLVIIANPTDLPQLAATHELNNIQTALRPLIDQGQIQLQVLENPTLAQLQATLRTVTVHVLHFIGHGLFDTAAQEGQLALCDATGKAELIPAQALGNLLHNEQSVRLVLLNSCEGSRTGLNAPFAGVAQTLVQQGVPAVIAMQCAISDQASLVFAQEFYAALAAGYSVDGALTEARVAISTRLRGGEWGIPRLFMRASDGVLWQVKTKSTADPKPLPPASQAAQAEPLLVLADLMHKNTQVRNMVATFRADFQAANQQIELLNNYKCLHDVLHRLQFRCYNVIAQELTRFPQDALALDNLINYEVTLQDLISELRTVLKQAALPSGEVGWVEDVVQAQVKLHDAIDKVDTEALKRTIWLLKRVIALQPSSVNQRLNAAARALRLSTLAEAMITIRSALGELPFTTGDKLAQFDRGVTALRALSTRLTELADDHDNWQAVERILSRIEDVMVYNLTELEFSWPDVQAKIDQLCRNQNEEWVQLIKQDSAEVSNALTSQNPSQIQRYFRRFRQRASNRFYQVDVMLKDLCEELRNVGNPLASVLTILE